MVTVPIAKLSPESRAQAKRLYELSKSSGGSPPAAPSEPISPSAATAPSASPAPQLNFTPPTPPTISPMAPFPENTSLQGTVDFIKAQVVAGHPEVFWYALPEEVRASLDSAEFRNNLTPLLREQAQNRKSIEQVAMKAVEVLVTKKQFLLNSSAMAKIPPPLIPMIQQAYDPAVGLVYEVSVLSFRTDSLADKTVTEMFNYHGPRIGAHLKALAALAPPGMIDQVINQIVVSQSGDSSGTITATNNLGKTETTEMVKSLGRWLPKDFAESWEANKDTFIKDQFARMSAAKEQNPEAAQKANMLVGMVVGMANGALGPMLAATTQEEFDQALAQVTAMLPMLGAGLGGGGE
jgi:hypothetical protein